MNPQNPRPSLLRSPPSIQLTTYNVLAYTSSSHEDLTTMKRSNSSSTLHKPSEPSRTQHKLMLQRQSFLADDKHYLDHPENMRRLTKELDRVNREYKCVRQFQDPLALSIKRVTQQLPLLSSSSAASSWSSSCSSSSLSIVPPRLQRRASSHTVHDYLMHFTEERRHSFNDKSPGFIGRLFGASQLKRHPHVA